MRTKSVLLFSEQEGTLCYKSACYLQDEKGNTLDYFVIKETPFLSELISFEELFTQITNCTFESMVLSLLTMGYAKYVDSSDYLFNDLKKLFED